MSDPKNNPIDLSNLTDDEIMNLSEDEINSINPEEEEEEISSEETSESEEVEDVSESNDDSEGTEEETSKKEEEEASEEEEEPNTSEEKPSSEQEQPFKEKSTPEDKETEKLEKEAEKPAAIEQKDIAVDFFKKVTAPFKADGKDFEIKSAEDAIRLMQQGVNYSRRMQELKPVKALNHMLSKHELNDPQKLSYLIDLHNGKPEAIQKLLKDHNIDPIEINTADESTYKASNYSESEIDSNFREAIEHTLTIPKGQEIINNINSDWDKQSKEALRENPVILNHLLEQTESGVYDTITTELNYQLSMGHLRGVPYLQAYNQVGEALQKAGVFDKTEESPNSQVQAKTEPIDTGPRKVSLKTKSEEPNQNISSLSQPKAKPSSNGGTADEINYSNLSDEEFLKLNIPE